MRSGDRGGRRGEAEVAEVAGAAEMWSRTLADRLIREKIGT